MSQSNVQETTVNSPIADLTYRNYDGPITSHTFRWWVVALSVLRTNLKKPGFWINGALIVLIFLFQALLFFFSNNVASRIGGGGAPGDAPQKLMSYGTTAYQAISATSLLVTIAALIVGSGSIAADNRANALLVYLSKPITKGDYLLGKWMGVFMLLAGMVVLPTILLWVFYATTYADEGFFKQEPWLWAKLLGASLISPVINTSLMIGFSACTKNARLAGSLFAAFTFILLTVSNTAGFLMFRNATLDQDLGAGKAVVRRAITVQHISVRGVADGLSMELLDVDPKKVMAGGPKKLRRRLQAPYPLPLVGIGLLMIILPIGIARAKIRAVEVVSG
jgi:ABC-2 type transport system permease protein